MLEMACQGLYRCTYMPDCAVRATWQLFSLRGAPDECNIGAKQLVAHALYHTFTLHKPALYMLSVGLVFEVEAM